MCGRTCTLKFLPATKGVRSFYMHFFRYQWWWVSIKRLNTSAMSYEDRDTVSGISMHQTTFRFELYTMSHIRGKQSFCWIFHSLIYFFKIIVWTIISWGQGKELTYGYWNFLCSVNVLNQKNLMLLEFM